MKSLVVNILFQLIKTDIAAVLKIKALRVLMGRLLVSLKLIGIYVEIKQQQQKIPKQYSIMATRLGFYPFNADICISNTDISLINMGCGRRMCPLVLVTGASN